jgi:uncharacterized protein (TIGR04255 family)
MAEPPRLPKKLKNDTIYEVVFETRFSAKTLTSSSILPGLLWSRLKDLVPRSDTLPAASLPEEMRNQNEMFAYQPTHVLSGDGVRLIVGLKVLGIAVQRPYPGWDKFKDIALRCSGALFDTGLIDVVDRCSLKYTNILSVGRNENDLEQLNVSLSLNGFALSGVGTFVKAEIPHRGCMAVVQVASGANVFLPAAGVHGQAGKPLATGVLLDVDTVKSGPMTPATEVPAALELLHTVEKEIFFSLLRPDTLEKLGPEWQ